MKSRWLIGIVLTCTLLLAPEAQAGDAPIHYHSIGEALKFFVVQVAAFALLFWFMKKFAWPILAGALDAHRERFVSTFRNIATVQEETKSLRASLEQRLGGIDQETKNRIAKAVADAQASAGDLRSETDAQIAKILARAKGEIDIERDKAILELRIEVIELAVAGARSKMETTMTPERQDRLVGAFFTDLDRVGVIGGRPK